MPIRAVRDWSASGASLFEWIAALADRTALNHARRIDLRRSPQGVADASIILRCEPTSALSRADVERALCRDDSISTARVSRKK